LLERNPASSKRYSQGCRGSGACVRMFSPASPSFLPGGRLENNSYVTAREYDMHRPVTSHMFTLTNLKKEYIKEKDENLLVIFIKDICGF
jgi:hypothetical protein